MKFTKNQLQKIILQEIKIVLAKSPGGCIGEEAALQVGDEDEPADFGSKGNMGQISEDDGELDPYDAPEYDTSAPRERPPTPDPDEFIDEIISQLEYLKNILLGS